MLAQAVKKFNKNVLFLPTLPDVVKYIKQKQFGENTVIITMGAGDVYKVGERFNECVTHPPSTTGPSAGGDKN